MCSVSLLYVVSKRAVCTSRCALKMLGSGHKFPHLLTCSNLLLCSTGTIQHNIKHNMIRKYNKLLHHCTPWAEGKFDQNLEKCKFCQGRAQASRNSTQLHKSTRAICYLMPAASLPGLGKKVWKRALTIRSLMRCIIAARPEK